MESCFISCSCGSRQPAHKMQSVNNRLVCKKCAGIAESKQKRENNERTIIQGHCDFSLRRTRLFYPADWRNQA